MIDAHARQKLVNERHDSPSFVIVDTDDVAESVRRFDAKRSSVEISHIPDSAPMFEEAAGANGGAGGMQRSRSGKRIGVVEMKRGRELCRWRHSRHFIIIIIIIITIINIIIIIVVFIKSSNQSNSRLTHEQPTNVSLLCRDEFRRQVSVSRRCY